MILFSQVGINTTNPEKELHIAGPTSTLRIEGLNALNNTSNTGISTVQIHVNADGDMVLPSDKTGVEVLINSADTISNSSSINIATGANGEENFAQLYSVSFTLTQPAVVRIYYAMSYEVLAVTGIDRVEDGKSKLIRNYMYLGDGVSPNFGATYGNKASTYANISFPGEEVVRGPFYNTALEIVSLPTGTHSIHIYGSVYASDGVTSLNTSDAFSASFGGEIDALKVFASY